MLEPLQKIMPAVEPASQYRVENASTIHLQTSSTDATSYNSSIAIKSKRGHGSSREGTRCPPSSPTLVTEVIKTPASTLREHASETSALDVMEPQGAKIAAQPIPSIKTNDLGTTHSPNSNVSNAISEGETMLSSSEYKEAPPPKTSSPYLSTFSVTDTKVSSKMNPCRELPPSRKRKLEPTLAEEPIVEEPSPSRKRKRESIPAEESLVEEHSPCRTREQEPTPTKESLADEPLTEEPPAEEYSSLQQELPALITREERQSWLGWSELESEPAFFNHILQRHSVKDVKIKEIYGVGPDFLSHLPQPVYGLIFLFKYRDDQEASPEGKPCPSGVWFANQTADNSCASVAILNILMNTSGVDLGETLTAFKKSTMYKASSFRGKDLTENEDIRAVHNSFVRREEVASGLLHVEANFSAWQQEQTRLASAIKRRRRRTIARRGPAKPKKRQYDVDLPNHFIAYVPVNGEVWRMDGMEQNPINIGRYDNDNDWLCTASRNITRHMDDNPGDNAYNFMAVCKCPLAILKNEIASNANAIREIESRLTAVNSEWREFVPFFLNTEPSPPPSSPSSDKSETPQQHNPETKNQYSPSPPHELSDSYGLTQSDILSTPAKPEILQKLERAGTDIEALLNIHGKLVVEEKSLQRKFLEEERENFEQADKAKLAMCDHVQDP